MSGPEMLDLSRWVAVAHAAASWFMVGLIWMVQTVHYPLFAAVGREAFAAYEAAHTRRMGWLLVLPWGMESLTAALLVVAPPAGVSRLLPTVGLGLSVLVAALTVAVAVPAHRRLSGGFDPTAHRRLVRSNWLRTTAWTGRGVIALAILALAPAP